MKRSGLLMVRAIETHEDGALCPVIPSGWTLHRQSGGWCEARRDSDGALVAAYLANTDSADTLGLFLVLGDRPIIDAIAASSAYASPLRDVWENRANGTVRAVLRRWPDWRIDGFVRDADGDAVAVSSHAVRLMQERGHSLPDPAVTPLPWNLRTSDGAIVPMAEADVRVTAIVRPAMLASMAAPWTDHEDAEATT